MIQFDLEYKQRNRIDWHYATFLIAMPAVIGMNLRFHPKRTLHRIFYAVFLLNSIIVMQMFFFYGLRYIKVPVPRSQISTVAEITDEKFRLAGSAEVFALSLLDGRVQLYFYLNCPPGNRKIDFFIC